MQVGERGQITIPKALREKYGLLPHTEVEFVEVQGMLRLQRMTPKPELSLAAWVGALPAAPADASAPSEVENVDDFIDALRGR
ncbi:MAG: AbrB/MazE/SpoVT family DNA-binding domain-containing protein [Polyangiales bacterium]